jgi:hypothetical protein
MTEEIRWPGKWLALLIAPYLLGMGLALYSLKSAMGASDDFGALTAPVGVAILLGLTLAALLRVFTRLSIEITSDALSVGFGPIRDRLPATSIVTCEAVRYTWWQWGGWGIRLRFRPRRAKLYNVPGDGGRAVRQLLENGRELWFSSRQPEVICDALIARNPAISATPKMAD